MGLAGAGKDTLADMVKEYRYGTDPAASQHLREIKFSAALKEICHLLYGWNVARLNDLDYKDAELPEDEWVKADGIWLMTRRDILKHFGTTVMRGYDDQIWVNTALRRARHHEGTYDGFIATDCRFPNEQSAIALSFGDRNTLFVKIKMMGQIGDAHPSEDQSKLYSDMEFTVPKGDMTRMRRVARIVATEFFAETD